MEDFTNSNLQLVLGVKEGTNFDRVQKPTVIIATLNGHSLETKKVQPDCNPQYATDLTWKTDKNALRKMRCNQTPIKVECYSVNDNGSREKLGYTLLSVRCAQIIHRGKEANIKTTWHNILGVRNEFNNCKPKLMLYLIIKEKDSKTIITMPKDEDIHQPNWDHLNVTPEWIREEHLIQLGALDSCKDLFLLHIVADVATYLNRFLQEIKENDNFSFVYNILDTSIRLKTFKIESETILFNEKIVLRIRTSLPVLINYLNTNSHFLVILKNNTITIAQSEIDLKTLITTSSLQEFRTINKDAVSEMDYICVLKNIHSREFYRRVEEFDKLPKLKIHVKLQFFEKDKDNFDEKSSTCQYLPQSLLLKEIPLINQYNLETQGFYSNQISENLDKIVQFNEDLQNHHAKSIHETPPLDNKQNTELKNVYNSYYLNIYVNAIKFLDTKPHIKSIEFRFYYPQGEIITTISNPVQIIAEKTLNFENVKCKLPFISTTDKIEEFLVYFAPKINICDATDSERKCIAQVSLDIKRLFSKEKLQCHYEASLIDCHNLKEIGILDISLSLEEHEMSTLNKIKDEADDAILDSRLAYKIVDELETWKERQQEMFMSELRKKEETHLTLLNQEWQRRSQYLEAKLISSIKQCKVLSNNLNKTTENFRLRKIQSLEKETKLIQANEELQWKYDRKLRQLQDALQKMQEEFSTKLVNLEDQNRNLLLQVESLNGKKHELEKIKIEQSEQIEAYKKASLSEDQTASVLQQLKNLEEKLDNAQKSKSFFKEEWGKAVKVIHRIKMENQQAIESQIKNSKEELDSLDLEEILHADSTALTYDQIALNEIQREIDIINPDPTLKYFKGNTKGQLFAPQSDLKFNLDQNLIRSDISTNSSANDRRLNMLIEERDSLLKTGNYTSEDGIIMKLNTEIRSILMNS